LERERDAARYRIAALETELAKRDSWAAEVLDAAHQAGHILYRDEHDLLHNHTAANEIADRDYRRCRDEVERLANDLADSEKHLTRREREVQELLAARDRLRSGYRIIRDIIAGDEGEPADKRLYRIDYVAEMQLAHGGEEGPTHDPR
jgi:hypothetical protein